MQRIGHILRAHSAAGLDVISHPSRRAEPEREGNRWRWSHD